MFKFVLKRMLNFKDLSISYNVVSLTNQMSKKEHIAFLVNYLLFFKQRKWKKRDYIMEHNEALIISSIQVRPA